MYCVAVNDIKSCTGCMACLYVCEYDCICTATNSMGFSYPVIDFTFCVKCGNCFKVCPEANFQAVNRRHVPDKCFAVRHKQSDILMGSSSGGAFPALIENICGEKIVYGACFDSHLTVIHKGVSVYGSTSVFSGSKYIQSDVSLCYKEIEVHLRNNKIVVFSGTPCQIAGMKSYLGNRSENIVFIELLCHGVASPVIFKEYLVELSRVYNSKILEFKFRDKKAKVGMWSDFLTTLKFENGIVISIKNDLFVQAYLQGILMRDCCLSCKYACLDRVGDIVLGDFWGLHRYRPDLCDEVGTSLLIPVTKNGERIIQGLIKIAHMHELPIEYAISENRPLTKPAIISHKREYFITNYNEKASLTKLLAKSVSRPSLKARFIAVLPKFIRSILFYVRDSTRNIRCTLQ